MFYISIALIIVGVRLLFRRYFPILDVPCISNKNDVKDNHKIILDSRDYTESSHENIPGAIQIPYAYLARHYREIPKEPIHLIASNTVNRNLSIRFLKGKGFNIQSYSLTQCTCK
ncbi:hypothetical protein ACFDTO_34565 [Microbacteriaceae bacterium 4G12]